MFQHHDEDEFKKIIDEFILTSSDKESIKSFLRNVEFEASKLGIPFYQMMFILIQNDAIHNRKSHRIDDKSLNKFNY